MVLVHIIIYGWTSLLTVGSTVRQEQIGYVGMTSRTTAPVHFEIDIME